MRGRAGELVIVDYRRLRLRPKPINSTREHMELVERMRAGDAIGAAHVNRQHRERASRELLKIFEQFKLAQM